MIDWNQIWKLPILASRQGNLENGYEKEEAAERYDRSEVSRMDGKRRAAALEIDSTWSVLDIGAGPETLALPLALARRAERIMAMETSLAMAKRRKKHIAEEGLSNIRILQKKWEDLSDEDVGDRDLIVASHSPSFLDMPLPAGDRAIQKDTFNFSWVC